MVKSVLLLLKMEVSEDRRAAIITAIISPRRPEGRTEPPTVTQMRIPEVSRTQGAAYGRAVGDFCKGGGARSLEEIIQGLGCSQSGVFYLLEILR